MSAMKDVAIDAMNAADAADFAVATYKMLLESNRRELEYLRQSQRDSHARLMKYAEAVGMLEGSLICIGCLGTIEGAHARAHEALAKLKEAGL